MATLKSTSPMLSAVLMSLIDESGITEAQLARAIKLPRATINRLKTGKITDPRSSTLTLIANYFHITIDQLLGYAPLLPFKDNQPIINFHAPVLAWDQVKNIKNSLKGLNFDNHVDWASFEAKKNSNSNTIFALKVSGEAMWPYFDDKSVIIIDTELAPKNRSFVVAYIANTDEIILRQVLIDGKSMMLQPMNSAFQLIKLSDKDQVIGVASHLKKTF